MMKEHYLKPVAVFLACLVIAFPFYVSDVIALSVEPPVITGNDGVQKYVKPTGDTIHASVKISDQAVEGTDVTFNGAPFNECHSISEITYKKQCTYQSSGQTYLNNGKITATIRIPVLYPSFQIVSAFYGDGAAPLINSFQISPAAASSGNMTLMYDVIDKCTTCEYTCAGIGKIKVHGESEFKVYKEEQIHSSSETGVGCSETGVIKVPVTAFDVGNNIVKISVYDRLDNKVTSDTSYQFLYDNIAPAISNVKLVNSEGDELSHSTSTGIPAKIMFDVSETHSNIQSIIADLSSMRQSSRTTVTPAHACLDDDEDAAIKHCSITIPSLTATATDDDHAISINVTDSAGNIGTKTAAIRYGLDDTAPTLSRIKSEYSVGDEYFLREKNNIVYVDVEDAGAGAGDAVLTDSNLVTGEPDCTATKCQWQVNVSSAANSGTELTLTAAIDDRAGNSNTVSSEFTVDKDGPAIDEVIIVNPQGAAISNTQSLIYAHAEFDESSAIGKAYADFGEISAIQGWQEGECEVQESEAGNINVCRWAVTDLIAVSSNDFRIYLNATDILGNLLEGADIETGLEIRTFTYNYTDAEGDMATNPSWTPEILFQETEAMSYWKISSPDHSPEALDRQVGDEIQQHVYFILQLEPQQISGSMIDVVSIELDRCTGEDMAYIASGYPELIEGIDKKGPHYLNFMLSRGILPSGNLDDINCTFTVISRLAAETPARMTQPEEVNLELTIPLYNMPLGEISDAYSEEIISISESWLLSDWISIPEQILKFLESICRVIALWFKLQKLFSIFNSSLGAACATALATGSPSAETLCDTKLKSGQKMEGTGKAIDKFTTTNIAFCKVLSCQLFWGNYKFMKGETKDNWAEDALGGWAGFASGQGALGEPGATGTAGDIRGFEVTWPNPQDSIITSVMFLCLPGVIHNLRKAAAIDCAYILCLADKASSGMSPKQCIAMRSMSYCQFFWGQLYSALPFVGLIDALLKKAYQALTNWIVLLEVAFKALCTSTCIEPPNFMCGPCTFLAYLKIVKDVACDLGAGDCEAAWEGVGEFREDDICSQAKEAAQEIKAAYDERHEAEASGEPELQEGLMGE